MAPRLQREKKRKLTADLLLKEYEENWILLRYYYEHVDTWIKYYWTVISALLIAFYYVILKDFSPSTNSTNIGLLGSFLIIFTLSMGLATIVVIANAQRSIVAIRINLGVIKDNIIRIDNLRVLLKPQESINESIAKYFRIFYGPAGLIILSNSFLTGMIFTFMLIAITPSIFWSIFVGVVIAITNVEVLKWIYEKWAFEPI